jgi:hypothetical protein
MAADALLAGFEETLWIDADVGFHPDAVDQLRSHPYSIVNAHQHHGVPAGDAGA